MSQGALDRTTFEAIEAYVLDRMSAEEHTVFEQRMASDASLRAEVELEKENIRAVELGGMRRIMGELAKEAITENKARTGGAGNMLKYAAAVAVILIGALWWMNRPVANERLFAEYFVADPGLPVAMGITDDPGFADAMVSYKEGHYAEARTKWEPMLHREPANDTLRYYMACAWLAEGDAKAALPLFDALSQEPGSAFREKAEWYLFLALLRSGDIGRAQALRFAKDYDYTLKARRIQDQLRK